MSDLIEKAKQFATDAHASIDQQRKYSRDPYIVHPQRVAATVATVTDDEAIIAAAWLHDVVEDTPITIEQIESEFGNDVANLVSDLTNASKREDGNRAERKAIDRAHTAAADPRAKTVKLADLIDNLPDLAENDPGFARIYVKEKELQLALLKEGDRELWKRAEQIVDRIKDELL